MSVSDPIANALTKIRNAYLAKHKTVFVDHCKLVEGIVKLLDQENFVESYEILDRDVSQKRVRKQLSLVLRYTKDEIPVLRGIQRISTPGMRVYVSAKNLPTVYNNLGCAIISTSQGVMIDRDAKSKNIGGEYVCKVW